MVFEKYPYSSFGDLNLDWILEKVREAVETATNTEADQAALRNFVETYFANLDVQEEINTKLAAMGEDGSLGEIVDPYVVSATAEWLAKHITPTSPAVDSSLSVAGAAADAAVVGNEIRDTKGAIQTATGITIINNWSANHSYIRTNTSPVDINTPVQTSGNVRYLVINCQGGDVFTITVTGGAASRAFCFTDADGVVLWVAPSNETLTAEAITAPNRSAYLIINDTSLTGLVCRGKSVLSLIETTKAELEDDLLSTEKIVAVNRKMIAENTDSSMIAYATPVDETHNGITYAWSDETCHVSGTATSASFTDIFSNSTAFPVGMKAGGTYRVIYNGTLVELRIYKYVNGTLVSTPIAYNSGYVTIPADATGIKVRLFVASGRTVDETVTAKITRINAAETLVFPHRIAMFGDSIMRGRDGDGNGTGVRTLYPIPDTIEKRLGVVCDNYGVSGMGFLPSSASTSTAYDKIASTDLTAYDIIVMCFGVNDGFHVIGDWNSSDEATCLGQFNKIVNYIFTQKPAVRLIVIAPYNGSNAGSFPKYWYGTPGGSAYSRGDLSNALKQACEYYNIPYIEQTNSPLNGFTVKKDILDGDGNSLTYMGKDGVHPSNAGYKAIGGWLSGEIAKLIG